MTGMPIQPASPPVNGNVSFWHHQLGMPEPGAPLPGDLDTDVAIVGAGYTGLWTAYYLKRARPELQVDVLEARFAGFGASGRNGGWLANTMTGGSGRYEAEHGRAATEAFQRDLDAAVDEVIAVATAEGIEADIVKGGELLVARNPAQARRLAALDRALRRRPSERHELLDARQLADRVRVSGAQGAVFLPQCARLHPAKLVRGLAEVVRGLGVRIHERTRALAVNAHTVVTDRGTVTARHVLRCTEGFTAQLDGHHRDWIPMNSSMIVTAPLPEAVWSQIGWQGMETVEDLAHAYVYLQHTADGRIALGGRGVPYRYGSRVDSDGSTARRTIEALSGVLAALFPAVVDANGRVPVAHAWSGVLGVPRDWRPTVTYDPATGLGHAGGYVGTGVTASNLAGRTLADLVLGEDSPRTRHPWVNHAGRRWEPEPLRYAGITALYRAYHLADAREAAGRRRRTHPVARLADVVSGR
jgi:glycine/D-amino acid oxidase-like deaminating enzyme